MSGFDDDVGRLETEMESGVSRVYPVELQSFVERSLETADRTPALLCLLSGRLSAGERPVEEAAGIQFVHAGLELTRGILEDPESWLDADVDPVQEDLDLLAADVLVTMGFDRLVTHYRRVTEVVNTFGRSNARNLDNGERDTASYVETYRAAVDVGCRGDPPEFLLEFAEKLAEQDIMKTQPEMESTEVEWTAAFDEPVYDYVREIQQEIPSGDGVERQ